MRTYPQRSAVKTWIRPVSRVSGPSSGTPTRSFRRTTPYPVKPSVEVPKRTLYKPTAKTSNVGRTTVYRKQPVQPTVIPPGRPSGVKKTIKNSAISRPVRKAPQKLAVTRSIKNGTVSSTNKLITPLPPVFVRPSVTRPAARTSRIAKVSRVQKRSPVKRTIVKVSKPVVRPAARTSRIAKVSRVQKPSPVKRTIAKVSKPAVRPAAKKYATIKLIGQPIKKSVKTVGSSKNRSKTRSNTNRLIRPFPISQLPAQIRKMPVMAQPVAFKPPKTLLPIRPVLPKTSTPKSAGPISKIVKANPSLKPTLGKNSKSTNPKPTIVTKKKTPVVQQPKPKPKPKYYDDADRPIRPGNDGEPVSKAKNKTSRGKKALKVAGWVAGTILVAGLIRHYLILPNIKDQ